MRFLHNESFRCYIAHRNRLASPHNARPAPDPFRPSSSGAAHSCRTHDACPSEQSAFNYTFSVRRCPKDAGLNYGLGPCPVPAGSLKHFQKLPVLNSRDPLFTTTAWRSCEWRVHVRAVTLSLNSWPHVGSERALADLLPPATLTK